MPSSDESETSSSPVLLPATPKGLAQAAERIRAGEVVAHPTETVYGLAVDPWNADAVDALFRAKGRPESNPVLLIVSGVEQCDRVAAGMSPRALALAGAFWPGPLSLVLPRRPGLPDAITAGGETVCVRCPGLDLARELSRLAGTPLTSTSANRSGEPAALDPRDIRLPGVRWVIDGGVLAPSAPSTICEPESGEILREGAIGEKEIGRVLTICD